MTQQQGVTPGVAALLGRMRGAQPVAPIRQIQPGQTMMQPQQDFGAAQMPTPPMQQPMPPQLQGAMRDNMKQQMSAPNQAVVQPNMSPDLARRMAAFRMGGGPIR